jgi:PBP1b-binding outer membrane lipoprotein LpoB
MGRQLIAVLSLVVMLGGCASGSTPSQSGKPTPTVPVVPVVPNDSIVTAQILSFEPLGGTFPWQIELRLIDSQDVSGYVNMTKVRIGQALLAKTKENMAVYGRGDTITGHLKFQGDERGAFFFLSDISRR